MKVGFLLNWYNHCEEDSFTLLNRILLFRNVASMEEYARKTKCTVVLFALYGLPSQLCDKRNRWMIVLALYCLCSLWNCSFKQDGGIIAEEGGVTGRDYSPAKEACSMISIMLVSATQRDMFQSITFYHVVDTFRECLTAMWLRGRWG